MGRVFADNDIPMRKTAQTVEDISSKVGDHFKSLYDPNNKVESILAFMGPGILWVLGFPWIAGLFALAEAFGFSWKDFFVSIKEKLRPILTSMVESKEGNAQDIHAAVSAAANESSSDTVDPGKIPAAIEKFESINDMLIIKKIIKNADLKEQIEKLLSKGVGNRMRKGILGFIIRIVSWVITAILISLGFALAGGAVSSLLGTNKKEPTDAANPTNSTDSKVETVSNKSPTTNAALVLNGDAPQELFTETFNDENHVWLMHSNISQIKSSLIKWAQQLYPQLTNLAAFDSSSSFNRTLKLFQDRNKAKDNVDLIAVPQPFSSIKDIVDSFAADVAEHTKA